ncbi:MAG: CAF17-like 4Fe-4S cluster assembly/insertion protein YgfZ [Gaiellaceae bacterium]
MDVAARERAYVRVAGPDAADYLQRMVSNDVDGLAAGEARPALLLTPKARVIAPVVVWRRAEQDFLVLTEPELGDVVRALLTRMRLRAKCEIELEKHASVLVFAADVELIQSRAEGIRTDFPGAVELVDSELAPTIDAAELEQRRIEAGVPRWGREIDERILPAEAGLDATHVDFGKGCYPGQEPVARLHYRGHPNRGLRVLELAELPGYDAELVHDGKAVGRVTSAARREDGSVVALAYVRTEVPADARLELHASA